MLSRLHKGAFSPKSATNDIRLSTILTAESYIMSAIGLNFYRYPTFESLEKVSWARQNVHVYGCVHCPHPCSCSCSCLLSCNMSTDTDTDGYGHVGFFRYRKRRNYQNRYQFDIGERDLKGIVSRDFLPQFFFIKLILLGP
jgi:hypothetical protein